MIKTILLVGIGGGLGSIFRYLTSIFVAKHFQTVFPIATLTVNILGSFIIGLLFGFIVREHLTNPDLKLLFLTGFCGGYTTFSAFALENLKLFQTGNSFVAFLYIAASILICLFAVWLGFIVAK